MTKGSGDLPDELMEDIRAFTDLGETWMEDEDFEGAVEQYEQALAIVPEPKTDYEASTWILGAIGDARFQMGNLTAAKQALDEAMHCPGGIGNPFLHLRLGQCTFELGKMDRAADELARAYMGAGDAIFEDEDPKYLTYVKSKLDAPAKPWWKLW